MKHISHDEMKSVYEQLCTPYKQGISGSYHIPKDFRPNRTSNISRQNIADRNFLQNKFDVRLSISRGL